MKPLAVSTAAQQATEFGGRMHEMAEEVRAKAESVQQDVTRNFRRAKVKAEEMLEEGRHEIKTHPLAAVSAFMFAGLALGFAAGMLVGSRRRCS